MTDCIGEYYTINGEVKEASGLPERLLETGLCLYEVVRVVNGRCLFPGDHLQRLAESVGMAGGVFHLPAGAGRALQTTIEWNRLQNGNLRLVWKEENGMPALYIWPMPFSYPDADAYANGVAVSVFGRQRSNPNVKQYVTGLQEAMKSFIASQGVYECLLTDESGHITEGSRTNVFFIRGSGLVTAPGDRVLKGITRGRVIALCENLEIGFSECDIPRETLGSMDAVFLTGTSPRVLPVNRIDTLPFRVDHPLMRRLMHAYDRLAGLAES